ncbi:unnamed protein product [Adineta steineri]|uniref:Snake toxin/toxin-like domain-containing protein n=1 Tax=Adineta steineri TaxID=433720 RepID=A0A818R344_9BILA|nr:unnamed protein product [Adineta steineri]CAF3648378.1 unnamed protein product [Adineta steineri]
MQECVLQTFFVVFLINIFLYQQLHAQPTSCVTCMNCQDVYDGTDRNSSCSFTTSNTDSCEKIRIQKSGQVLVSKGCSQGCREQTILTGTVRFDIACCKTDNCNQGIIFTSQSFLLFISFIFTFI